MNIRCIRSCVWNRPGCSSQQLPAHVVVSRRVQSQRRGAHLYAGKRTVPSHHSSVLLRPIRVDGGVLKNNPRSGDSEPSPEPDPESSEGNISDQEWEIRTGMRTISCCCSEKDLMLPLKMS